MRNFLKTIVWLVSYQFGIDVRKMAKSTLGLPRFFIDLVHFSHAYHGQLKLLPCLHDWHEEGGCTKDEYFWQDLYIAQKIHCAKPKKHVDIGSRVDGFVAHIASFRDIEVLDIRPITAHIPHVTFQQADLMNPFSLQKNYCDSLSCLHALEHFGLGRYGDPINVFGYETGLKNISDMLQTQGILYLSVPVGRARVEFNAHRIFDPLHIVNLAESNGLLLENFARVESGVLTESNNPADDFSILNNVNYALGIFIFRKF